MKKYYYSLFAAATMLLATTSCSQDEELVQQSVGDMTTFKVELQGAAGSRTAGDGLSVNKLYYAVYNAEGTKVIYPNGKNFETASIEAGQATVNLPLMKTEKYDIVFWAQNDDADAYSFTELTDITVNYDSEKLFSNKENRDAFFNALDNYEADGNEETIQLRRPFAQLNVATHIDDWNEGTRLYEANGGTGAPVKFSAVTVSNLANKFNAKTGEATKADAPASVTFNKAELIDESIKIKGTEEDIEYKLLAMNYVLMEGQKAPQDVNEHVAAGEDEVKATVEVAFTLWKDENSEIVTTTVSAVPVQRNYRTNILGNFLTGDNTQFNIQIAPIFDNDDHNIVQGSVDSSEELGEILKMDKEHIVIELGSFARSTAGKEYVVEIAPYGTKAWGTENTKTITINANGNTINFKNTNSDWNAIYCTNKDAKLIINNAYLTNSGYNGGPWNRHDIYFINEVELNNVTSDKAIALNSAAKLNSVSISDEHVDNSDTYGLWIRPTGQTVEIDNLTIVAHTSKSGDRGIKIDEQYLSEEEIGKVALTVKNSKFVTQEKAAIMVKSQAGADITLENVDISGVAGDDFNAVWVDEDGKDQKDKVNVSGGFVIVEGTPEGEANPFLVENKTINLPAGTYGFPSEVAKGVTIKCEEGVVFAGTTKLNINGATVEGATFSNPSGTAVDKTINGTFKNCTFEGQNGLRWAYAGETCVFEDCVFSGSVYGAHFDGGANDVKFVRCTFSGFNAFGSAIELLTFEDCTFKSNGKSGYNGANLWGTTNMVRTNFEFDGSASTEWIGLNAAQSDKSITLTDCKVNEGDDSVFDYFTNYNEGNKVTVDNTEYVLVSNAEGLTSVIKEAQDGAIISLAEGDYQGHFDLTGKKVTLLSDSKKATVKGSLWADNCTVTVKGLTLTNPEGVQHPNPTNSTYYNTINNQCPLVGAYLNTNIKFEDCTFDLTGPTVYGFYGYADNTPVFEDCTFNCNKIRPIANNGPALTVNNCTFNNQYHYSARIYENSGEKQTIVFTNNTIQGENDKNEFEGINISKKGTTATVLGDFTIKGNTNVKYRHHKDVTMSENCVYTTDIENFAFEKED